MPVPVLSVAQMREWEQATWAQGIEEQSVIAEVGRQLAARVRAGSRRGDRILVLAGKGHNGDDARQAAPHLRGRNVEVLTVRDPKTALPTVTTALEERPAWVVDGLFGIGLNRSLGEGWPELIACVNQARCRVLSVDVPSGLDAETGNPLPVAIEAALTFTLGAVKHGLLAASAWPYVGRLEVAPRIGLVDPAPAGSMDYTVGGEVAASFPRRPVAAHKGNFGHVAILAGSLGYHGAAVLAARGASRAQPGLVTVHTLPVVYVPVAGQVASVMVRPWKPGALERDAYTALMVGPGLADPELPAELWEEVRRLWKDFPGIVVADASALDHLPPGGLPGSDRRVVTPHPGEAGRLLGWTPAAVQADRPTALRELSARLGGTWVVLKGHQTLIGRAEGRMTVNGSGNPHLAQGGSGDLLAGFLAGLLAQPAWQGRVGRALEYGVWAHGAAADWLSDRQPHWTLAELEAQLSHPNFLPFSEQV